ncbi:MAG: class I SAM-dependent methyltransferase, partial [Promethearchaeota archaeon]
VKREANFYDSIFKKYKVKTVLDCACGTGHHVMMLKELGFDIKGSDLSPAMIVKARANLKEKKVDAILKISDFKELNKNFDEMFDAVICVGNSLPHLLSDEDLISALAEMNAVLNENGILILEQRNYDKLLKSKNRFFPVSFKENEVFFYVLDFLPTEITFNIININTSKKTFQTYTTTYNVLKIDKLKELLNSTGFKIVACYDDYDFNDFNIETSDRPIILCKKS